MSQKQKALEKRYFAPGETTEDEMYLRVAQAVAFDSNESQKFFDMMSNHEFLPNSPTLMNAGVKNSSGQLAACFVLPIDDSMESIFETLKNMAIIQKTGGGVGYSFGRLRPKDAPIKSTFGTSSGPISFMKVFDGATESIKQGGRRRGANMGVMPVWHPDIERFITCKDDNDELNNFNISVGITDDFIYAVKEGAQWPLTFNRKVYKKVNARELWDKICYQAWKNGEPGVIFLDKINATHPIYDEEIEATNPCGEQPLLPYECCNLGSINLSKMVDEHGVFDWDKFKETIYWSVRFLDNVIDVNKYPLLEIEETVKANRKIGLGIMGYADMLIKIGLVYGSDEALEFTADVADFFDKMSIDASKRLAQERGTFPNWSNSKWADINQPMRNATTTTIAPTGTISIIAECSGGIEPLFAYEYEVNRMDTTFTEYHPLFKQTMMKKGIFTEYQAGRIDVPKDIKKLFVCAHDVTPEQHVKTQSIWQKHIHNAVSKTINLPSDATVEDVKDAYGLAYESYCKGVTVYRDGSRGAGVLSTTKKSSNVTQVREATQVADGTRYKIQTGCGTLYMMVFTDDVGKVREIFTNSANGGCTIFTNATSRLISLALRGDIPVEDVIDQLESSGSCPSYQYARGKGKQVAAGKSCPSAVAKILREYVKSDKIQRSVSNGPKCPECGAKVDMAEGCMTCHSCGYSKCS